MKGKVPTGTIEPAVPFPLWLKFPSGNLNYSTMGHDIVSSFSHYRSFCTFFTGPPSVGTKCGLSSELESMSPEDFSM